MWDQKSASGNDATQQTAPCLNTWRHCLIPGGLAKFMSSLISWFDCRCKCFAKLLDTIICQTPCFHNDVVWFCMFLARWSTKSLFNSDSYVILIFGHFHSIGNFMYPTQISYSSSILKRVIWAKHSRIGVSGCLETQKMAWLTKIHFYSEKCFPKAMQSMKK